MRLFCTRANRVRGGALVAVVLAVNLAAGAAAAPAREPKCRIVRDDADDVRSGFGVVGHPSSTVDIISGDLAANSRTLTAVIRVKKLVLPDPTSQTGVHFSFSMRGPESRIVLSANFGPDGDFFDIYAGQTTEVGGEDGVSTVPYLAPATGVFDRGRNEIRIHAALVDLAKVDSLSQGARLSKPFIEASTGVVSKNVARSFTTTGGRDVTATGMSYTMSERTCVKPGA